MGKFKQFLNEADKFKPAFSDPSLKDDFSNLKDLAQMHDHLARGKALPKKLQGQVDSFGTAPDPAEAVVDSAAVAMAALAASALVLGSDKFDTSDRKSLMKSQMKTKQEMKEIVDIEKMLSDNMDLLAKKAEVKKLSSKIIDEYLKKNNISLDEGYEVEVAVRDARKANDIAQDMFRGSFKNDGSNVFVFKKEEDMEDFLAELETAGLEVLE